MKQIEKISSYHFELSLLSCIMHVFLDFCIYSISDKSALKCSRISFLKTEKALIWKLVTSVESLLLEQPWEKQMISNYQEVWKVESNITVFDWWSDVRFASNNLEFWKTEGSRNQDCIVV